MKTETDKSDKDKTSTDSPSTSGNSGGSSSGGSSGSGSSGGSSGSGSSGSSSGGSTSTPDPNPTPPAHVHNWTPVYKDHPAVPAEGYEEWVPDVLGTTPMYFFGNGHSVAASVVDEQYGSIEKYMRKHGLMDQNYWTGYEVITPGYYKWVETSPAKPAWRELTHYVCNADGATKNP